MLFIALLPSLEEALQAGAVGLSVSVTIFGTYYKTLGLVGTSKFLSAGSPQTPRASKGRTGLPDTPLINHEKKNPATTCPLLVTGIHPGVL